MNRRWWVVTAVALVMALFVGWSALAGGLGFPLDDGWIHQTYARSLAQHGRWEYVPGVVSAGSTAPLWTLLLALGYALRLPYLLWAFLLGGLALLWLALAGMQTWRVYWPELAAQDWLAGLTLALTWPLVWGAASGMETILFAALGMQIVALYGRLAGAVGQAGRTAAVLGVLSGLLILTRPDGVVLVLLVVVGLLLRPAARRQRVQIVVVYGLLTAVPLLPYFAFNLSASGSIWPNTFYAKQAEYQALLSTPLLSRFVGLLYFSLGGPSSGWRGLSSAHLLLLPGLVVAGWRALQADWSSRRLLVTLPLWWAGGHVLLYAWRLPVTYQHGRYLFAALPIWLLYGLAGWLWLWAKMGSGRQARIVKQVAGLTFGLLLLLFLLLGAQSYAADVAFIEGEMVDAAHWLAANTPPDALIAAHDIGAIGYFAQRPLLDLAGLISPEIIPLLADEMSLAAYVRASDARYLVTAPGWEYQPLTSDPEIRLLYATNFAWTAAQGVNGTAVYQLP
ncbi:MAG: hypothetical protein IPM39_15890 [Chloroflexi bacterium]|nr:hypothetical protein [Chloroflexota bacterium]